MVYSDEKTPITDRILQDIWDNSAVMPFLWYYEVRNMLVTQEKRGRITLPRMLAGLKLIRDLQIIFDNNIDDNALVRLSRHHQLTIYDASYLELAIRMDLPLATFDKALAAAAKKEGVTLLV